MEILALWLLAFVAYFVVIPALTYLHHERTHRLLWRRREVVPVTEDNPGGPFRDEEPGDLHRSRDYVAEHRGAPQAVKVTVVVSLVLGHMFIPGLLAGLFGLVFYGIGLVSIPGLILAARIYRNAFGLLRCEPKAAADARDLRSFALMLNGIVLAIVVIVGGAEPELAPLLVFTGVYALISIAHAQALGRAADAIEAVHHSMQTSIPRWVAAPRAMHVA